MAFVAAIGAVGAQQRANGAAWLLQAADSSTDRQQSRPEVLDTPVLPGSVMKTVTLVAALESHAIDPQTARICRRVVTVDGRRYTCSHPDLKRPLTAAEALAHSCNDFFVSLAPRLSRTSVNDVRARLGLPPIPASANFAAALVGLDGPRIAPRKLLDVFTRLIGLDRSSALPMAVPTRRVLLEGLRGAAEYGSASELGARRISALAKTGTAPMPGGGALGLLFAVSPADAPRRAVVVVAPGAAGRDATSIAGDLLAGASKGSGPRAQAPASADTQIRVGAIGVDGRARIESVPLEDYVARVLAGEGRAGAPDAAQQALAIAARTFALANRDRHRAEGFDLCDTTHCQVLRPANAMTRRAAAATSGRVLVHDGRPASIYYSAWCGGRSELASEVWPGAIDQAFAASHDDEACRGEPAWKSELTAAEVETALRTAGFRGRGLRDLEVVRRTASGRVARLRVAGFAPGEISGQDFRTAVGRAIGWERLKSTLFDMRRTARGYAFTGRGSGHGVGMCVLGAVHRAATGATAEAILGFYYPGLRIESYTADTSPRSSSAANADVQLALPAVEESDRIFVIDLVRKARDQIAARAGIAAPAVIRITVHADVDGFTRTTGRPWWTAGATTDTGIDLLPLSILKRRGQLERTIRHEVAHVLLDRSLRLKPAWVREGAALHFTREQAPVDSTDSAQCPTDSELLRPASGVAQREAYARAEQCFRAEIAKGKGWDEIE